MFTLEFAMSSSSNCAYLHINDELAVSLYRKSDVLLDLPEFGRTPYFL